MKVKCIDRMGATAYIFTKLTKIVFDDGQIILIPIRNQHYASRANGDLYAFNVLSHNVVFEQADVNAATSP